MLNKEIQIANRFLGEREIQEAETKINVDDIIDFLSKNPNPDDSALHSWAEKKGYNVHDVETQIYKFATKFVAFLVSGRANKKKFTEKDADAKELKMGIEVEKEHTPDEDVTKRIAMDHLAELKDYYTRLKKMEAE